MRRAVPAAVLAALTFLGCRTVGAPAPAEVQQQAQKQLAVLEDILRSKNDNDPRLDTEFWSLSPEAKALFRDKYQELQIELRNERGTIVFLLGREPRSDADWGFLRAVAAEPPCLSLADCSRGPRSGDAHPARGDDVTLAYPALVALKQAQRVLEDAPSEQRAMAVVAAGSASRSSAVARMAARIIRSLESRAPAPSRMVE